MTDEVLAVVGVSRARLWMGVAMLGMVGGLAIYVALATPPMFIWQLFLIVVGALAIWVGDLMRRSGGYRIELTRGEMREAGGEVIARVDDIVGLDRGVLAFKPSNGFVLKTRAPVGRRWRPGLWWRIGRRVGIGGIAPGRQTRVMADILAALIAERG